MTTPQFDDFCKRWLAKADSENENNLNNIFDKFLALFIVYNALYSQVTEELIVRQMLNETDIRGDKYGATKSIPIFLTHEELARKFEEDEKVLKAIETLLRYVDTRYKSEGLFFSIYYKPSKSNKTKFIFDEDGQNTIVEEARDSDVKKSTVALLTIIYHIRSNMFHGQKPLNKEQKYLIKPTIIILRKIIDLTLDKL